MSSSGGLKLSAALVACVCAAGCPSDPRAPTEPDAQVSSQATCSPLAKTADPTLAVEYFARVGDDRLVVTRPAAATMFGDLRLFFGAPDHVSERVIEDAQRYKDGGSTKIVFDLDGEPATVFFPNKLQSAGPAITEPVTFDVDGTSRDITRADADDAELQHLTFECQ